MWIPRSALDLQGCEAHFAAMTQMLSLRESPAAQLRNYVLALLMVAAASLAGLLIAPHWGNSGVDLLYLPGVLAAAGFYGLMPGLVAAGASALAFNYFFTAPIHTFRISSPQDVVTVALLFLVALVTSQLAARMRAGAAVDHQR